MTVLASKPRKKLIEVALPLEAINVASAREKSIRHGHPSTLHLWWARRPLAACRAVIFASLVDDPDSPDALPAFVVACRALPYVGKNVHTNGDTPRMRLFDFIERLVQWESTTDEAVLNDARRLIQIATEGNPPPLLDPFAGGGSIPLEAQRLGLRAYASDLNPVAVMINKAQIEIPPRFANMPPVNPRDRAQMFAPTPDPSAMLPPTLNPSPKEREGNQGEFDKWEISPELERRMQELARELRNNPTPSEDILWQAIRKKQLDGRKFRRQVAIGAFVLDFYCSSERLAVEVDGAIHESQQDADKIRQELIESVGIRFVRLKNDEIERDLDTALAKIRAAFLPSLPVGEGLGVGGQSLWKGAAGLAADVRYYGEWMREQAWERIGHLFPTYNGETVIAWLWARTVKSPNPAVDVHVPLVKSFELTKKKGRRAWVEPQISPETKHVAFVVRHEESGDTAPLKDEGTLNRKGGICIVSGVPITWDYIRAEGQAGHMKVMPMAIITEGHRGRNYYSPDDNHVRLAEQSSPKWQPEEKVTTPSHDVDRLPMYGLYTWGDAFTPRQLVALTTFSDLVAEAREQTYQNALAAGLPDNGVPLRDGGCGAQAYADAISVYLSFAVDRLVEKENSFSSWQNTADFVRGVFARQAIAMVWDYAEVNPFSGSSGNFGDAVEWVAEATESILWNFEDSSYSLTRVTQTDAANGILVSHVRVISTDPPYYDNIGYADLSDFFYVWMRRMLREVYPDIFSTMLVPKELELIASPSRHGGREAANTHFEGGLRLAFANMHRTTGSEFPLSVYYAFKQSEAEADGDEVIETKIASTGWETMLSGLVASGFSIHGTWPMRSERGGRTNSIGANALASSIVLVCRPRPEDAPTISRRQFVDALRRELPAALKNMQSGNIAPVDLAQASIGPGMAIYSRYSAVLEADGSHMAVRAALGLINQELDAHLAEQDGDLDGDTRFAVAWFEQFGFNDGDFGLADVLARAKNTSVGGVEAAGVVKAARGKVKLVHWTEYDAGAWTPQSDKRPTIWEAAHHLIERLNSHGEAGSALLMTAMPPEMAAGARTLAYRLYNICERKGWADHARDYNALVISWAEIGEQAARVRQEQATGQATEQIGLGGEFNP